MLNKDDLKQLILAELNQTKPSWRGKGIPIKLTQFGLSKKLRDLVNEQGYNHGCHTCLTRVEADSDQPWVGDHIPPTELANKYCLELLPKWDYNRYLFPQCHQCSAKQSGIVKSVQNGMGLGSLDSEELKLLGKDRDIKVGQNCIKSSGPKVSDPEGKQIQNLGIQQGCKTCSTKFPTDKYIADHSFPQEFCTAYMEMLFSHLGLPYPKSFDLRPQCAKCSGHQGGKMLKISIEAQEYCRTVLGITVNKY